MRGVCGSSGGPASVRRCISTAAAQEVSTTEQQQQQEQNRASSSGEGPADASQESSQQRAPSRRYSPLHQNIEEFCRRIVPTREERAAKQRVVEAINACTRRCLEATPAEGKRVKVQPFGSHVSGLSTWNSDVDIVISGLVQPSRLTGGFDPADKRFVTKFLDKVARELRRMRRLDLRSLVIIRTARIPIIKLQTGPATGSVVADISLGDESGPAAARYVTQQIAAYPPLAPLVLVLKVYLRRCGLNEVANGGLSSYSLTLMVLAHLQEEIKAGNDVFDLGEALYGFLLRYGEEFDYYSDAVSVASGGIVPKIALGAGSYASTSGSFDDDAGSSGSWHLRERLMVDDPLTGRDISVGTHRIDDMKLAFSRAAKRLEALAQRRRGASVNYLSGLFEVESALSRSSQDVHGRGATKGGRGGPGGGGAKRQRGGGGRGGPPQDIEVVEEYDLEVMGGDEMMYEQGARRGGDDEGEEGGGSGGKQRRGRRD